MVVSWHYIIIFFLCVSYFLSFSLFKYEILELIFYQLLLQRNSPSRDLSQDYFHNTNSIRFSGAVTFFLSHYGFSRTWILLLWLCYRSLAINSLSFGLEAPSPSVSDQLAVVQILWALILGSNSLTWKWFSLHMLDIKKHSRGDYCKVKTNDSFSVLFISWSLLWCSSQRIKRQTFSLQVSRS